MNDAKYIASPVGRPVRQPKKRHSFTYSFSESLLPYFPDLKKKLHLADIPETSAQFIDRVLITSLYVTLALSVVLAIIFHLAFINLIFVFVAAPFIFAGTFFYLMLYPDAKIVRRQKNIDSELVFAGRHILIALRAGMPLFDSLVGASYGYGAASEEFRKIVDKVSLGVPMGQAIRETANNSPSSAFARIAMQLANAISSGANVADSLEVVLNQVAREQAIALKAYGQKLNPLVMFFMIFGIIFPSLGVAFAIIIFSLVSGGAIGITSSTLLYVLIFIAAVQFMFLSVVENSRPKYML